MDDHYVDRVEKILLSPDKESISPSKAFSDASAREKVKVAINLEPEDDAKADSGLDSSANSDETTGCDKFVDHREDRIDVGQPEAILSPTKVRDREFNIVDNQSQSQLDAMNNNSEEAAEWTQPEYDASKPLGSPDPSIGKEGSLHGDSQPPKTERQISSVDIQLTGSNTEIAEHSMNLYWYSTTLDLNIDPKELEELETPEVTSPSFKSTIKMSVGDGYYKEKNKESDLPSSDNRFSGDGKVKNEEEENVSKEVWSSVFESASSRFLDLASEMNTEPKAVKNSKNSSIKNGASEKEPHPWGLDVDTRVKTEKSAELSNDLPELESVNADESIYKLVSSENKEDVVDGKFADVNKDEADAVGFMELSDRDKILASMSKAVPKKDSEKKDDGNKEKPKDETDAVGYMERFDKPIIEKSTSTESASLNASQSNVTVDRKGTSSFVDTASIEQNVISSFGKESDVDAGMKGVDEPDSAHAVQEALVKEIVSKVEATAVQMVSAGAKLKLQEELLEPTAIERTFKTAEDTEDRIIDAGGKLLNTEKIIDEYLDDVDYTLTLKDCWLRFRNKRLEMKVNASQHCSIDGHDEISDVAEIKKLLLKKFPKVLKQNDTKKQIPQILEKARLVEFVTQETVRKRYQLGDCVIVLDQTDFGFQVGQIEATARNPGKIANMLTKMQDLANKLNLRPLQSL